jgi:integrase
MAPKKKPVEKQPRRKPGTGTLRHRAGRAKPWQAEFKIEGAAARSESFQSEQDARAWLDQLVKDRDDKTRDIAGGSMLVQDYLPMWLSLREGHVSPKTMEAYTYYCEYACGEGGLGRLKMDAVTALMCQQMVNRLAKDGFQNTAQLKSVLYQAFEYAFDVLEYTRKNVFAKVKVPPIDRKEGIALTKIERARMLSAAELDDDVPLRRPGEKASAPAPLYPFWHLTSRLAFRRGEASSLKWEHVDFENAIVTIATTRGRLGKTHIEGKTKNKKIRVAPMPLDVVELMRAFKAAQMRAALAHGWRWSEKGYVFVDDRTGLPLSVDHLRYRWGRIKTAAGLPKAMTVHDLRHTSLTILALDGIPQNVRMALAGHKTEEMSDHYANHASIEDVRRALG